MCTRSQEVHLWQGKPQQSSTAPRQSEVALQPIRTGLQVGALLLPLSSTRSPDLQQSLAVLPGSVIPSNSWELTQGKNRQRAYRTSEMQDFPYTQGKWGTKYLNTFAAELQPLPRRGTHTYWKAKSCCIGIRSYTGVNQAPKQGVPGWVPTTEHKFAQKSGLPVTFSFQECFGFQKFSSAIGKRQGYGKRDMTVLIPLQKCQQAGPAPTVITAAGLQTPQNIPRQTPIPLPQRRLEPPHSPVSGLSQRAVGGSHSPQKSQGTQSLL